MKFLHVDAITFRRQPCLTTFTRPSRIIRSFICLEHGIDDARFKYKTSKKSVVEVVVGDTPIYGGAHQVSLCTRAILEPCNCKSLGKTLFKI